MTTPNAISDYQPLGSSSVQYKSVFSPTDVYYLKPTAAVWNGSTVVTFTQANHNLASSDSITITCNDGPTLVSGGTGYTINDILTLVSPGPTSRGFSTAAQIKVLTVDGSGVILTYQMYTPGSYWILPNGTLNSLTPIAVTGGTGSGATFTVVWTPDSTQPAQNLYSMTQWTQIATVTVIDANNFTIPMTTNPGPWPNFLPDGTPPYAQVTCANYSKLMFAPKTLQLQTLAGGNTLEVDVKIAPSASWVILTTMASTDVGTIYVFDTIYNFVRIKRTAGSAALQVYAGY